MALTMMNFTMLPQAPPPLPPPCETFNVPIPILSSQQRTFRVGVLAIRGVESAAAQWKLTFGDYLTATAGNQFDPPISFEMVPVPFGLEREPADEFIHGDYDFVYANPSMFSCVDSEVGMNTLASLVSKRKVNGQVYSLTEFGGVIFTWANNTEINSIKDLVDKRLGLVSIAGLGSGQMQFREMIKAGLHHLQDPRQLIFVENQGNVVKKVLSKDIDVGFVRTDQLDRFVDPATGELLDQSKVKIIGVQENFLSDGSRFPFAASSVLYPEWALASFSHVGIDVDRAVQKALMNLAHHSSAAKPLLECYEGRNCTATVDPDACEDECFRQANPFGYQTCDADAETTLLADKAQTSGKYSGWRTPLSYMTIRNMQEEIGYIQHKPDGSFQCLRGDTLADSVVCPEGHFKKAVEKIATGCEDLGMDCLGFKCLCKPCVASHDVDFFPIESASAKNRVGCDKFDVCGAVQQSHQLAFRAVDNRRRENTTFVVMIHGDGETTNHVMTRVPATGNSTGTYEYEFEFNALDSKVGFLIMEVDAIQNGVSEQISQSPFRLEVEPRDCEADTGDDRRVADVDGSCICDSSSFEVASDCMPLGVFIPAIIIPVVLVAGIAMFCYFMRKRQKEDLVWQIKSEELTFDDPPHVLGKGRFGAVTLGKYRGTEVAVKQLLDPKNLDDSTERSLVSQEGGKLVCLPAAKEEKFPEDSELLGMEVGIQSCLYVQQKNNKGNNKGTSSNGSLFPKNFGARFLSSGAGASMAVASNDLKSEMRLLSKLRHPNVVTIMGCTEDKRLVMEYMELGNMCDVLNSGTMVVDDAKVLNHAGYLFLWSITL